MVANCANPSCSAVFRYLHEGTIFHVTYKPAGADKTNISGPSKTERFWLCGDCSAKMTLISKGSGVLVVARPDPSRKQQRRRYRNTVVASRNDSRDSED